MKQAVVLSAAFFLLLSSLVLADVKYESTSSMQLAGTVGKMMNFFGGGKPVKTVDYYKGDVKRSDSFDNKGNLESSHIVDLNKELFITVQHDKKQYTQMTFDEWKEMLKSTMESLGQEGEEVENAEPESEEPEAEVDWDVKVDVQETGEKETIAGKQTEKVVLTLDFDAEVTAENEESGEMESAKGGMIVTSSHWLYKGGDKAKSEMDDFNKRFVEKLGFAPDDAGVKEMMANAMQENSQLGEAIKKMQEEGEKLQGLPMRINTVYETKVDPETLKKMEEEKAREEKQEQTEIPTSVGGLLGGLGKKALKNRMEKKDEGPKERNTLMTSVTEVLAFETTSLDASLFVVPADYKLVERDRQE